MNDRPTLYAWQPRTFEAYRPPNRLNRGLVTMAPWLDAVLLVIFFLTVTSRFVLQPGIQVRLPEAPFTEGASPYGLLAVVVVQELPRGAVEREILYFDDERFVLDQPAHQAKLKEVFIQAAHRKPGQALVIEADRRVRHGRMVALIDTAAAAGITEVYVATRPEEASVAGAVP